MENNTKQKWGFMEWCVIACIAMLPIAFVVSLFEDNSKSNNTKPTASYSSYTSPLTTQSDGYDWNNASYDEKRSLAKELSDIVRSKGISDCSANFYFDALNEAYNTNSNFSLKQSIYKVAGTCTGLAQSLPAHKRNY